MRIIPAEAFHVGAYIAEELESRHWTIWDLVGQMGQADKKERGIRYVAVEFALAVHDPSLRMGNDMAELLAMAFGVSVEFLLNIERQFVESAMVCSCEGCAKNKSATTKND